VQTRFLHKNLLQPTAVALFFRICPHTTSESLREWLARSLSARDRWRLISEVAKGAQRQRPAATLKDDAGGRAVRQTALPARFCR
jgi:hypothetical protein